jgi:hypothetical protein
VKSVEPATASTKLPGVIDTLSAGYKTLNKHPYLLLTPVIMDIFYWLGPRLSVQALAQRASSAIQEAAEFAATGVANSSSTQSLDMLKTTIESIGKNMNLFSIISSALSLPTLLSSQEMTPPAWIGSVATYGLSTFSGFIVFFALLFLVGIGVGAVYMGLAAQTVRAENAPPAVLARQVVAAAARYMAILFALMIIAVIVGLPASLLVGVLTLVSPLLGSLVLLVMWTAIFWLYVNLFFTVQALFVSNVGPVRAILNSITVVRLSTSSALGLIALLFIVSWGMSYVWSMLGTSDLAIAAGILGNAYIGTGLTIAGMIFYRDRINAVVAKQM